MNRRRRPAVTPHVIRGLTYASAHLEALLQSDPERFKKSDEGNNLRRACVFIDELRRWFNDPARPRAKSSRAKK